jgi:uncharacterized protein (TIGR02147 family)
VSAVKEMVSTELEAAIVRILQSALERLKIQRELVSLRSLAAGLKVSPSYLSKVLRGQRRISASLLGPLARLLRLDHHEVAELQRLSLEQHENRKLVSVTGFRTLKRAPASQITTDYKSLSATDMWILERWYYLPLINIVTTVDFVPSVDWIAARLGITADVTERAIDRLVQEGHLSRDKDGGLQKTDLKVRFPAQRSHPTIRSFHQGMLKKATVLLDRPPTEAEYADRLVSGLCFAGDPSRMAEAKLVIEQALYKAAEILAAGECTEVFQLGLQLFKLSRDPKN